MIKFILTITILIFFSEYVLSQEATNPTKGEIFISSVNLYYEVLGSGLTNSANLEVRFGKKEKGFGVRAGFGYFYLEDASYSTIPFAINFVVDTDRNKLELGLGATLYYFSSDEFIFDAQEHQTYSFTIMYRFQPEKSGVIIRAGFTPMLGVINGSTAFIPYIPGFSIGYKFEK